MVHHGELARDERPFRPPGAHRARSERLPDTYNSVVLNTLADLTNRENRWAYQRFANDFQTT